MAHDWLPKRRTDQLAMAKNWAAILVVKATAWGIDNADVTSLNSKVNAAQEALNLAMSGNRSQVVTAQVNTAFAALISFMRNMKNRKFFVPPLNAVDLASLGLRPRDTIITPIPDPTGQAEADVMYPGPHLLRLVMKPLAGTTLDPRADHGYRIYYGVLPPGGATMEAATGPLRYLVKPVVEGSELPHSLFTRRRRELFEFPETDSGMTAYFAIRFENAKGGKGPWGPVFSAVIP